MRQKLKSTKTQITFLIQIHTKDIQLQWSAIGRSPKYWPNAKHCN